MTTIDLTHARDSRNQGKYRDKPLHEQISIIDPHTGRDIVTCRIYYPAQTAYAALWVHPSDTWRKRTGRTDAFTFAGAGKAGGYGYCKASGAIDTAIRDAGIKAPDCHGYGMTTATEILVAIAKAVSGRRKVYTVRAHA